MQPITPRAARSSGTDQDLAAQVAAGSHDAFEALMRRHNTRLFRVARAILKNDGDAEDVLQEAYLQVYRRIGEFRGGAQLSTWLTRIVINQALMRLRKQHRDRVVVPFDREQGTGLTEVDVADETTEPPPDAIFRTEIRRLLESKIDELPVALRTVFVMREVEDLTVEETAACLAIPPATVRTRLFRARARLREALAADMDRAVVDVYGFAGDRCDRIVAGVLSALRAGNARS